jgi:hypothetical protein
VYGYPELNAVQDRVFSRQRVKVSR